MSKGNKVTKDKKKSKLRLPSKVFKTLAWVIVGCILLIVGLLQATISILTPERLTPLTEKFLNKALTAVGYTSYPLILRYLYFTRPAVVPFAVAVPASGFFLLTFVRKKINRPRPYEALDINPIIIKNTKG